ncbi:hypothetical protein CTI12_AA018120 [Artemisia annua]|uniref:Nucleoporin Nup54 alpha-helical domain-containing protein n=1 Tax=Artemisia annua TaxID=35608 RepID=A0A2U1QB35_ARTAN|nr:hypothetical protein CTI12_AA018120 [Artemisia annua]
MVTQMAPVAPLPFSLADRDIQAILDAYKDEIQNPKYAFKHLLFSVTEPQHRAKPAGVSDIMWAEAMGKLEGMESSDRERLWPQLVKGFKDLSERLKITYAIDGLYEGSSTEEMSGKAFRDRNSRSHDVKCIQVQDEVILSDAERLQMTQTNVKVLQRHFQADTFPRIERLRQSEKALQRRLLRLMRILEALEAKGFRLPLNKGEVELAEKLATIIRQLKGSGAELTRRVQNLLTVSRVQGNGHGGASVYLPGSTKIHEQSLSDMHEVLQQQTEAVARLGNVLKRDIRDMEIIMAEDTQMLRRYLLKVRRCVALCLQLYKLKLANSAKQKLNIKIAKTKKAKEKHFISLTYGYPYHDQQSDLQLAQLWTLEKPEVHICCK